MKQFKVTMNPQMTLLMKMMMIVPFFSAMDSLFLYCHLMLFGNSVLLIAFIFLSPSTKCDDPLPHHCGT